MDIVCNLLEKPFSNLDDKDKIRIVIVGRPTIPLPLSGTKMKTPHKSYTIKFKPSWFSNYTWLCSSPELQKLFCWPCLLFSSKHLVWSRTGYSDILNVARALHKHDETFDHINCLLLLKKFERDHNIVAGALEENAALTKLQFNENVRLNRAFFRIFIDATLYLGEQELFRGQDSMSDSLHASNFKELLGLLISRSSLKMKSHYEQMKTFFSTDLATTQNEINMCLCIYNYINRHIIKDIKQAPFFAIQIDDVNDSTQTSRCSVIIRYVNSKGQIVERFLGFYDVSADRTTDAVYTMLDPILKQFDCQQKLIGQCYDGASIKTEHLNVFQKKIKARAPLAAFVPSVAHRLDVVLQDSLKKITDCRIFFASLGGISSFFHYLSNKSVALASIPKCTPTIEPRWWSSSDLIYSIIVEDWVKLKEVFAFFVTFEHSDQKTIQSARVILNDMNDFDFTFMVVVFNDIFSAIHILYTVLQEKSLDTNACFQQVLQTREILFEKKSDDYFMTIFNNANSMTPVNVTEDIKYLDITTKYKVLFYEILDHVLMEMDVRFQDCEKLQFLSLADSTKFPQYQLSFPADNLEVLQELYVDIFPKSQQRLKSELHLLYSNEQLTNMPLQELLINVNKDKDIFIEAYKLLSLVATVPSTNASRTSSCLERIKALSSNITSRGRLSYMAAISIEKELLLELKSEDTFYEDIIDQYASLNQEIDLVYKS